MLIFLNVQIYKMKKSTKILKLRKNEDGTYQGVVYNYQETEIEVLFAPNKDKKIALELIDLYEGYLIQEGKEYIKKY